MAKKTPSKPAPARLDPRRWIVPGLMGASILAPLIACPPLRLLNLQEARANAKASVFDAAAFAKNFWEIKLIPALADAVDAAALDAAIEADPAAAAKKYARSVGIGGTAYYFVTGEATVTELRPDEIHLTLPGAAKSTLLIETGLIFGNALRDGTGLLDINTFANSEEYNAISAALNTIAETTLLPELAQKAKPGAKIRFTAIAELTGGTDSDPRPLRLIPIQTEIHP